MAVVLSGASLVDAGDGDKVVEAVRDTLERWNEPWLLIFDNYDDPNSFPNIQRFMPKSKRCAVD